MIHSTKRLIITANHRECNLIESKGLKIHKILQEMINQHEGQTHLSRHDGSMARGQVHSSLDHHTPLKVIEKSDFAHTILKEAKKILDHSHDYKEIILMAEPKMLGLLKQEFHKAYPHLPVYKTLSVDPAHMGLETIEEKIFSS